MIECKQLFQLQLNLIYDVLKQTRQTFEWELSFTKQVAKCFVMHKQGLFDLQETQQLSSGSKIRFRCWTWCTVLN